MAAAFLVLLIIATLVVAGFLLYGMFLGIARLGALIGRTYSWLTVQDEAPEELRMPPTGTQKAAHLQETTPAPKCWEIKGCPLETRAACPAFNNPDVPCWMAWMMTDKERRVKPDCLACTLFSIPSLMGRA